jgi:hypothetical protein
MEYEDWAARARAADTVEEQAKVLEMAKNVRMPVGGLQGLLKTGFERAKEAALGTREEKGLFPEVPRPVSDWEIKLKQANILYKEGLAAGLPEKQARDRATAILKMEQANVAAEKAKETAELVEPKKVKLQEEAQRIHAQEDAINKKLPEEIKLMQARAANFLAKAKQVRGGGGGRGAKDELLKAYIALKKDDQNNIDNVDGIYKDSLRSQATIQLQADNDERDAATSIAQLDNLKKLSDNTRAMMDDKERLDLQFKISNAMAEVENKKAKAAASKKQAEQAAANIELITNQRAQAIEQARQNTQRAEGILQQWGVKQNIKLEPVTQNPIVTPGSRQEKPKGFMERLLGDSAVFVKQPVPAPKSAQPAPTATLDEVLKKAKEAAKKKTP